MKIDENKSEILFIIYLFYSFGGGVFWGILFSLKVNFACFSAKECSNKDR